MRPGSFCTTATAKIRQHSDWRFVCLIVTWRMKRPQRNTRGVGLKPDHAALLRYSDVGEKAIVSRKLRPTKQFKTRVAIEAISGHKAVNQIASKYGVYPSQVHRWKREALERLPEVLSDAPRVKCGQQDVEAQLYQRLGQLTMEWECHVLRGVSNSYLRITHLLDEEYTRSLR